MAADHLSGPAMSAQYVVDDAPYLWLAREVVARGPNGRLIDLARHDERLDAYLDAMRVHRATVGPAVQSEFDRDGPASGFLLASFRIMTDDVAFFATLREEEPNIRSMVAALARAEREAAGRAIDQLNRSTAPIARAIGIAALGARRSDAPAGVAARLADPSAVVRARAYRTTGQLGRADLVAHLRPGLIDPDPECRFWSAWAAARMGATEPLDTLADIAWNNLPRADRALDLLLRRLDVPQANAWLREFAKLPDRQRSVDPRHRRHRRPALHSLADRAHGRPRHRPPRRRVVLHDHRPRPRLSRPRSPPAGRLPVRPKRRPGGRERGTRRGREPALARSRTHRRVVDRQPLPLHRRNAVFPRHAKASADWLEALSDAFQRQRHAAALELAIRQPDKAMFEVRARGRLQRQLIARARGLA